MVRESRIIGAICYQLACVLVLEVSVPLPRGVWLRLWVGA